MSHKPFQPVSLYPSALLGIELYRTPEKWALNHFFRILLFGHMTSGILAPQPGIDPTSPALEEWNLNHWTTREVLP